jgi:hypothetical protein
METREVLRKYNKEREKRNKKIKKIDLTKIFEDKKNEGDD